MKQLTTLLLSFLLLTSLALAQPAADGAPPLTASEPPTEALQRLAPYFGSYALSGATPDGEYAYAGTLEVGPAVNGWFVEWVFDMNGDDYQTELRMLSTYDDEAGAYRIWRFESRGAPWPPGADGTLRFEGGELVMEWEGEAPDGTHGAFRNRVTREGRDLRIVTEGQRQGHPVEYLVDSRARRLL